MEIKITWVVEDGYVGHGKQESYFNTDDYEDWDNFSEDEKETAINDFIQEEFLQNVSWNILNKEVQ